MSEFFPIITARRLSVGGLRLYEVDGALYPSVTSILSVISKPNLVTWARRTTIEAIRSALDGDGPYSREWLESVLEMASQEPERVRDLAAQRGASIHEAVARALSGLPYDPAWEGHVQAALRFLAAQGLQVVASEQVLVSKRHGFAGTCDVATEAGRSLVLLDWKTGGLFPEMALQLGAYSLAIEEMIGQPVTQGYLVALRERGCQARQVELAVAREAFLAALVLWKALRTELLSSECSP